jgi:hypothetical protein
MKRLAGGKNIKTPNPITALKPTDCAFKFVPSSSLVDGL